MAKLPALAKSKRQHEVEALKGMIESAELETRVHHPQLVDISIDVELLSKPTLCDRLENVMYALLIHSVFTYKQTHSAPLMYDPH
jgi:hypothetical protein